MADPRRPLPTARRLVVATYNVHAWVGTDGRLDPDRTVGVIRSLGADVVGLQEVTLLPDTPGAIGRRYLAEATGMEVIAGPTLKRDQADFGNALLSTLPIRAIRHHDLSPRRREPRGLLDVDLQVGRHTVRVLSTHLGKGVGDRRWQAKRIIEVLDRQAAESVVLMGDMNEWLPGPTALHLFDRWFGRSAALRTYPASLPLFRLDRIWVRTPARTTSVRVHTTARARQASDHLPLRAELQLP